MSLLFDVLKQRNVSFLANADGFAVPDAGLYLADVSATHHKHTETRLTDTTADSEGKLVIQKHLMEGKSASFVAISKSELTVESLAVNTNTHRRNFK